MKLPAASEVSKRNCAEAAPAFPSSVAGLLRTPSAIAFGVGRGRALLRATARFTLPFNPVASICRDPPKADKSTLRFEKLQGIQAKAKKSIGLCGAMKQVSCRLRPDSLGASLKSIAMVFSKLNYPIAPFKKRLHVLSLPPSQLPSPKTRSVITVHNHRGC